ncbi:MAG: acyl-CoA thioesterase [Burkholderiales bacterium]|jgi:4-hydroxybenzoyl-CoA thioesterase|nr:acyl-CoA thioesterase [Burkholderiales bacterium]
MTGRFERPRHIRFAHCDPAGIVFYPQYLVMFNGLVEDWITDGLGISYPQLIGRRRVGLPTVSLQCEFKAVSRMGDDVTLGLQVEAIGNRSLTLRLDCVSGEERRVQVRNVIVTTSLETHRAIAVPDDLREAVTRFRDGH